MYFALGLFMAGVLALLVMPAIWRRTARLTRQRIESSVPMTLAEIQADKDQIRAEFAMTARRLEMTADRLRDKTTEQVIDINQKRAEIVRLSNDRDDKAKAIEELEARAAGLESDLKSAEDRLAKANERIGQQETTIAEHQAELARLRLELDAAHQLTDEQKLEIVARNTEIGNLNDRLDAAKAVEEGLSAERDRLLESLAAEQASLAAERQRVANLEASLERIEAERIDRLAELERRATEARNLVADLARNRTRADDLTAKVAELEAERAARTGEFERRTAELSKVAEAAVPIEPADGDNIAKAIAATEAENTMLTARLTKFETEQTELRAENEHLRRMVSSDWDIETENAILRDRLVSVAADVIRQTRTTDETEPRSLHQRENGNGNGEHAESTAPQFHDPAPQSPAAPPAARSQPIEGKTLAERLRALQHTASRH